MKVYIVLEGVFCEGGYIKAVFRRKEDACNYLEKNYKGWTVTSDHEREDGCTYAEFEEWEVTDGVENDGD